MTDMRLDICLCTFRRPSVAETLRSLAALDVKPDWKLRVIVADNDDTDSARALVEATAQETGLTFTYIHAPARNISVARNACLDAATAPLLAFIDDDELVTPGWLAALVEKMEESGADVVLGPVRAIYGAACPAWMRKGDFHSTLPARVGGEIVTGATCNVLLRRLSPPVQGRRFRVALGKSGGEDTVYFSEIHKAGGRIVFAPGAEVTEIVPPARARLSWLLKRRFRSGQTHGLLLLESGGRVKNILTAAVKSGFCFFMALANVVRADRSRFWLLRGALHAGVVSRLLGKGEIEQYGGREKT